MIDRTAANLFDLFVRDRLACMASGPERDALNDAWTTVMSAIDSMSGTELANHRQTVEFKSAQQESGGEPCPDPVPDSRQKAWEEAEAAGLGWPGPDFTKEMERRDT